MIALEPTLLALYRRAAKAPMCDDRSGTVLTRSQIEDQLPHRAPLLFLDSVSVFDSEARLLVGRRHMSPDDPVFAGHFPSYPVWPGVLQVEAIGQAGVLLQLLSDPVESVEQIALTHIVGAKFVRPVRPGDDIEIVATTCEDGLFFVVVGQVLVDGKVASVAAVRGMLPD